MTRGHVGSGEVAGVGSGGDVAKGGIELAWVLRGVGRGILGVGGQ